MSGLKAAIGFNHIRLASMKGSILQNEIYCSKEGQLVHFGLPFIGKGGRRDLQVFYDLVRTGANDIALADHDFGTFARTLKATDRVRLAMKPARRTTSRQLVLLVGVPGSGKTRMADDLYPNMFTVPYSKNLWIDGYQGEKEVLFEEFTGQYPLNGTLQLFDPWKNNKFEIKGNFQWFTPDVIVITSNTHPKDWYDYSKRPLQEEALRRRLTRVLWFTTKTTIKEYATEDAIRNYWPIPTVDNPSGRAALPPVRVLNPIEEALRSGNLCHACYVVPCACLLQEPPQRLLGEELDEHGGVCGNCNFHHASCECSY